MFIARITHLVGNRIMKKEINRDTLNILFSAILGFADDNEFDKILEILITREK